MILNNKYSGGEMTEKTKLAIGAIATVAITAGVAFALYLLFYTNETHVTMVEDEVETSVLVCRAMTVLDDSFFDTSNVLNVEQEVKTIFNDNMPDKLNYLYSGDYVSAEGASKANDLLHADYNIYMADKAESLTPTFSIIDNKLRINLFADKNQMNSRVGKLFFLSNEEVADFVKYKAEDLMKLYQNKGFSCELEIK